MAIPTAHPHACTCASTHPCTCTCVRSRPLQAGSEEYWAPTAPLLAIEFVVLGFLELKRFQGWKETGTSGFLNAFPFDPAGAIRWAGSGGRQLAHALLLLFVEGLRGFWACGAWPNSVLVAAERKEKWDGPVCGQHTQCSSLHLSSSNAHA